MKPSAFAVVLCAAGLSAAALLAQAPARPAFDVASVRPAPPGRRNPVNTFMPGGRYVATNMTLRRIVTFAYLPLLGIQVTGGPAWMGTDFFDIEAKADGSHSANELRSMLQTLLVDRFKFQTHTEKRDAPVWALLPTQANVRSGSLKPSTTECPSEPGTAPQQVPGDPATGKPWDCGFVLKTSSTQVTKDGTVLTSFKFGLAGKGISMAQLVVQLSNFVPIGRLVLDRSGFSGTFDFEMWFANDNGSAPSDAPSIYTALQEQLGLKLQSMSAPVDFLVIDGIEHPAPD